MDTVLLLDFTNTYSLGEKVYKVPAESSATVRSQFPVSIFHTFKIPLLLIVIALLDSNPISWPSLNMVTNSMTFGCYSIAFIGYTVPFSQYLTTFSPCVTI